MGVLTDEITGGTETWELLLVRLGFRAKERLAGLILRGLVAVLLEFELLLNLAQVNEVAMMDAEYIAYIEILEMLNLLENLERLIVLYIKCYQVS